MLLRQYQTCADGVFAWQRQLCDTCRTPPNNSFSGWMTDYSKAHQGRISRQAYMDEAGRRWDAADKGNQGLTTDDINRTYGYGSAGGTIR